MPCMGPDERAANEIGAMAYEDIMKLLQDKYYVSPKAWSILNKGRENEHKQVLADFQKAIKELVWYDHCCTF